MQTNKQFYQFYFAELRAAACIHHPVGPVCMWNWFLPLAADTTSVADTRNNPSIGEGSVGGLTGSLSASGSHMDRVGTMRDNLSETASTTALAGASITGSLSGSAMVNYLNRWGNNRCCSEQHLMLGRLVVHCLTLWPLLWLCCQTGGAGRRAEGALQSERRVGDGQSGHHQRQRQYQSDGWIHSERLQSSGQASLFPVVALLSCTQTVTNA